LLIFLIPNIAISEQQALAKGVVTPFEGVLVPMNTYRKKELDLALGKQCQTDLQQWLMTNPQVQAEPSSPVTWFLSGTLIGGALTFLAIHALK
jgi:hypothetical protein